MDIIIRETGERRQLNRISPGSDYDAAVDTLNDYGALADGQFEDTPDGELICSQAVFEYWEKALAALSALDERRMRLVDEFGSREFDARMAAAMPEAGGYEDPEEEIVGLSEAMDLAFGDRRQASIAGLKTSSDGPLLINFIPDMPEGWKEGDPAPWRDAQGYPWASLVLVTDENSWGGERVDRENSTPGIDLPWRGVDSVREVISQISGLAGADIVVLARGIGLYEEISHHDPDPSRHNRRIRNKGEMETLANVIGMWPGGLKIEICRGTPVLAPTEQELADARSRKDYEHAIQRGAELELAGKLLPAAEINRLRRNYNLAMNEGGEGYNPYDSMISKEYFEFAQKELARLNAKLGPESQTSESTPKGPKL